LALVAPLLNGCSQLGIAKVDDITAMETRLQNADRATDARVDNLEQSTNDMQATLNQITSDMDSLNVRFARAKEWLETMNIDTISADAQEATEAAISAEARSRAFFEHYLAWIKDLHATLEKQLTALEAQMEKSEGGTSKPATSTEGTSTEKTEDAGGGG
jgi:predicted  nucleic acid-binding Zn-ribbon protein